MLNIVRQVNSAGVALLMVEQSLSVAAAVCSRALFLEKGEVRSRRAASRPSTGGA